MHRALLIADQSSFRNTEVIDLMRRAEFEVDLITHLRSHYLYRNISRVIYVPNQLQIPIEASKIADNYHLIIPLGDVSLKLIKDSNLSDEDKLKLLPVIDSALTKHICSKIELSNVLQNTNVLTPKFRVLESWQTIEQEINNVGYPALIKIDYSGGGVGVFKLNDRGDISKLPINFRDSPLILQQFIQGKLVDASAFYQNMKLIGFSYSETLLTTNNPFGPSKSRVYSHVNDVDPILLNELTQIGKALAAHGFVNLSFIESEVNQKRYFFEADMRPNDWVNCTRHVGDDLAIRIKKYFFGGEIYSNLSTNNPKKYPNQKCIFFNPSRLNLKEIFFTAHSWIKFVSLYSLIMHWGVSILTFNLWLMMKVFAVKYIKPYISERLWQRLRCF